MKKIVKYLVAAAAMVAAVSCQEELALNEKPAQNSGKPVFSASLNNLNTKTVLEEESMKTLWTGGEWINVMDFEGVNNIYSTPARQEPAQTVEFSFMEGGSFYGKSVFAMYPYNEDNVFWSEHDAFGFTVNHPVEQVAAVGTFDTFGPVHVAYNADFEADNSLDFKNLSALIKFTVTDPGVKKITFYGLEGERVSGPVTYRYDNGNYVIEDTYNAYDYVDLKAPDGQYLEMGKNYYIAVVPGTFESGVAIEVNNHLENKITYKHEGKVTLRPNTINNFGSFETMGDLAWELVGDVNGWTSGDYFTREGDLFVIKNKEFTGDYGKFKIRWYDESKTDNSGWNNEANYGLTFKNVVEAGGVYDLANGGWTHDAYIHAGTYDIWFDPFGMKLYVMDPGVDPAEAKAIAPTRYVVGTHNGWNIADTTYEMEWDGSWLTSFIEFTGAAEFKTSVGGSWDNANWGVQLAEGETTYKYESGSLFGANYGGSNVILPKPGFYMIQQSWDGYSMVVTDVVAPARGSQIYIPEAGVILDLGAHVAGKLSVVLATDYPIYKDAVIGSYDYKILPDSPTTGKIAYESDAFASDGYIYISYSFDGDGVMSVAGELGFEGYAEAEVWTEDSVMVFEDRPEVTLEGMWVGYTSTDDMVLLDMTEEKKLTYSYLAKDADGNECWIKMIDSEAYTINKYEFGTSLAVGEVERVTLFPVSKEAMILAGNKAVKFLDEEIEIWPITSLKEEELPETFYDTPDFKQWNYEGTYGNSMVSLSTASITLMDKRFSNVFTFDNVWMPEQEDFMTGDIKPAGWYQPNPCAYEYTIIPTDDESGVISVTGVWAQDYDENDNLAMVFDPNYTFEISYSQYTGTKVSLDLYGELAPLMKCTLATEFAESINLLGMMQ